MEEKIDYDNNESILRLIVKKGELPSHLYKYTDAESLKLILKNSTIKFSNPKEFNDPFDCNITIDADNTQEEIEEYLKLLKENKNLSDAIVAEKRKEFSNPEILKAKVNNSVNKAKERLGVTCFSKIADSLLMWAHYSDKHKGVCLKFDILADPDFFMLPFHVLYKKEYPNYNYIRNRDSLAKFLLETKSIDWKYEEEIRLMKDGPGFYKFNKFSLVEVIFGAKMPESVQTEIIQLLKNNGYNNASLKVSNISQTEFKLEIKSIP